MPRFARPGRRGQLPDDLADAFGSVVRVPADAWAACDHLTLPAHARLARVDGEGGLRIATAPLIRDPDELRWEVHERAGLRFYRIHPADLEPTERRIEQVVKAWDERGASIGIAPELCLSPRLLDCWQAALTGRESTQRSALRLVLAGSGNVEQAEPPANAAVLLDALTGEVLVRQRKIHPFNFSPADVELWGLGDRFEAPIDEDLSRGERLCVIEAGGVRLVILVCEDLARLHAFSAAIHAHGVSLILVPVFARPTKDRRWERARAEIYSDATGSSVVVANSLVVAAVLGARGRTGTAIAVAPGQAAVGHAAEPDDVVVFALDAGVDPRVDYRRLRDPTADRQPVPSFTPGPAQEIFTNALESLLSQSQGNPAGVLLLVGLAAALWSASGYIGAFIRASNSIYGGRGGAAPSGSCGRCRSRSRSLMILLLGRERRRSRGSRAHWRSSSATSSEWATRPCRRGTSPNGPSSCWSSASLFSLLLLGRALTCAQPGFRWLTPGGGVAVVVWLAVSAGFAFYVCQLRLLQQDVRDARRRDRVPDLALALQPCGAAGSRDQRGAALGARPRRRAGRRRRVRGSRARASPAEERRTVAQAGHLRSLGDR